ncbi:MAG: insulinase family protein [Clostridia bacterium]|nr:insulinase family protein [Clostridia bacterium]
MNFYKEYDNGLRLIINKMDSVYSVSCGVMVKTGSAFENADNNGISHFVEHCMFKGTVKRTAFEISDSIDRIGAQINAYTSKEATCYYTKSTSEHFYDSLEILSDIFFNSKFDQAELDKEKGVVIEEINMCEDTPEDICLDLLAESYYGKNGLGQTILGPIDNIKKFTRDDLIKYIGDYYTPNNIVIAVAGNVDEVKAQEFVKNLFADKFTCKSKITSYNSSQNGCKNLFKKKDIEQSHIGICMPSLSIRDDRCDALSIANIIFGGGMSSRLFQKIREELGLCYTIYSYQSPYLDSGILEIYSGVNNQSRDLAFSEILKEIDKFNRDGVTKNEFIRGKEQIKSSFIMGQESTASQMLLYARNLLYLDRQFDFKKRIAQIESVTFEDVNEIIKEIFKVDNLSVSTVGKSDKPLNL